MYLTEYAAARLVSPDKCAKQTTIAIVVNGGRAWIGSNWCSKPQTECPRKGLPTGVGYEMCSKTCGQLYHAEADACRKAGANADGATLYLLGHTYCCDSCKSIMAAYGIRDVVIGKCPAENLTEITYGYD